MVDGGAEGPVLGAPQGTGAITENAAGMETGISFTLTDADTVIASTITANSLDIDPNSFAITARGDTDAKFADMFEFAREGTSDTWTLKLKPGMSIDYEDEDLDADDILQFSVQVTDPTKRSSETRNIDISVENVDEIAPVINTINSRSGIRENVLGADTGFSFHISDEITPGVRDELESSNFHIALRAGVHRSYANHFELVREGTSDVWRLKLKDELSLDYEGSGLIKGYIGVPSVLVGVSVNLSVRVTDNTGNVSERHITVEVYNHHETIPTLNSHLRYNVGTITENIPAADTGLRFTVTDADTPFSTTGRTADITDIDPDSFIITAQDGTDDKFADMFEVLREGTSDSWRIYLKNGVFLNYEDPDLPAADNSGNKRLNFSVKVTDPDGNTSTTWYFHVDVRDANEASPELSEAQFPIGADTGTITENAVGADADITFTLTDSDSLFATTGRTAATNDIDPDSFTITAADGTDQKFADLFEIVVEPRVVLFPSLHFRYDNWKLKLRDGMSIDYEDPDLHDDGILHFDIQVTDPQGNKSAVRSVDVAVRNVNDGPHILPNVPGSLDLQHLTENQLGADTGISFIVTDAGAPISYTVTPATTDIDPSSFSIRA